MAAGNGSGCVVATAERLYREHLEAAIVTVGHGGVLQAGTAIPTWIQLTDWSSMKIAMQAMAFNLEEEEDH